MRRRRDGPRTDRPMASKSMPSTRKYASAPRKPKKMMMNSQYVAGRLRDQWMMAAIWKITPQPKKCPTGAILPFVVIHPCAQQGGPHGRHRQEQRRRGRGRGRAVRADDHREQHPPPQPGRPAGAQRGAQAGGDRGGDGQAVRRDRELRRGIAAGEKGIQTREIQRPGENRMKTRNLLVFVALLAFAGSALAALSPEKAKWGEGPVQFLMTKEEAAQWKTLQTDAFVTVFWARRGGVAAREDQEARWKYSDEKFSAGKMKGSMSDRGKILSLFGLPTRVLRAGGHGAGTIATPNSSTGQHITDISTDQSEGGADSKNQAVQMWIYEGDLAQRVFGAPRVELRFYDRFNTGEFKKIGRAHV